MKEKIMKGDKSKKMPKGKAKKMPKGKLDSADDTYKVSAKKKK